MRKIINSATTQYEPLLTEELVLDDRPISGSFHGITSDAVYKAISVDPGNVPPVESTDDGKVLTASYSEGGGSFEWATPEAPQSELPEYSSTEVGKVLGVVADYEHVTEGQPATILDWVDQPANELPAQLGTAGQVLTVNNSATGVEWATPSGGGGGSGVVELITVTSTAASNAQSLYNQVNSAVTNGKIPVLFTANSSNSRLMRYWYLHRTNSWDTSDKYYVFRSIDTPFDQSTSKYSYVANEMNVGTSGGSNYVIDCYTVAVASGLTWGTLDPFTA